MKREQTIRRERSAMFAVWLWALVGWSVYGAWSVYDLGRRYDAVLAAPTKSVAARAGARIGADLAYASSARRIMIEWAAVAAVLALFMFLTRGRTVIEERWVDASGQPAPAPDQSPPRPS